MRLKFREREREREGGGKKINFIQTGENEVKMKDDGWKDVMLVQTKKTAMAYNLQYTQTFHSISKPRTKHPLSKKH